MNCDLESLEERRAKLAGEFSTIIPELTAACERLKDPGIPPPHELLERCGTLFQSFVFLREELHLAASPLFGEPSSSDPNIVSLEDMARVIAALSAHRQAAQDASRDAVAELERFLRLTHRDDPTFGSLAEWKTRASELRHLICSPLDTTSAEVESLLRKEHPLQQILLIVEPPAGLEDEEWERLLQLCEKELGRPLALAAARGKLSVGPPSPTRADGCESNDDTPCQVVPGSDADAVCVEVVGCQAKAPLVDDTQSGMSTAREAIDERPVEGTEQKSGPDTNCREFPALTGEEPLTTRGRIASMPGAGPREAGVPAANQDASVPTDRRADTSISATAPTIADSPNGSESGSTQSNSATETVEHPAGSCQAVFGERSSEANPEPGALEVRSCFETRATAAQMAAAIRHLGGDERAIGLRDLIWKLLDEERPGLAYHVASSLEALCPQISPLLPDWLLRSAALAPSVSHGSGQIAEILKEDFGNFSDQCFPAGKAEWNHALRLLFAASTLRPALLVPSTGAPSVLQALRLKEGLSHLYDYCQTVAAYAHQFQALNPNALKRVKTQAAWESDRQALVAQVESWCSQAPRMTLIYAPATRVWQKWQEAGGLIYSLLQPIRRNDTSRLDVVRQLVERLSNDAHVRREIDHTDRKVLGRRPGDDITARALGQLRMHLRTPVTFAERWLELTETRPDRREDVVHSQAARLREELTTRQHLVEEELRSFAGHYDSLAVQSGVTCCLRALEDIRKLFDPDTPFAAEEPQVEHLLHSDLLHISSLPLDAHWGPDTEDPEEVIAGCLAIIAAGEYDWRDALAGRSVARDHEATARIIEYLEARADPGVNLDELRQSRKKHLEECRDALWHDLEVTSCQVEGAVAFGLLRENDRNRLAAVLQGIEILLPDTLKFKDHHQDLLAVREELETIRRTEVEAARHRLESRVLPNQPAYARILSVLEDGDVLTANEYIDMAAQSQDLPDPEVAADSFTDFFLDKFAAIEDFWKAAEIQSSPSRTWVRELVDDVAKGRNVGPISLQRVAGAQARGAAEMLRSWFLTKQMQRVEEEHARTILMNLGFNVLRVTVNASRGHHWINVATDALRDRNRCPVPAYGSLTGGRYRILCVWGRPTEEDLINSIGETTHNAPALVFYFGRMTEKRRRDLARLCRQRRRTFLVIDDTLLLYLCGERGSRLPVLFACALPFTFLEPYTTTASLVPPEMFYGRERERDQIIDRMGAWFIYGGRQLGKTALLRDVERTFHSPDDGRIALWLDLKTEGITSTRSIDEIWSLIATELKNKEVLPASLPAHTGVDRLFDLVEKWLDTDEQRRILLLLDEADRFLEADAIEGLIRLDRIKGLMDRTERRFKVVFAGLHNVLRTTKLPEDSRGVNPSLGHSQEPICIGPLLDNGEWREARALIQRPMASLGYQLPPDLVTRILSQTNYYPSLIQLYCNHLLRHVSDPHVATFDPRTSPPYIITSRHVEEAYQSQELRNAIRHRFNLTLQLDRRYEVIGYAIAYEFLSNDSLGMIDGFPVAWIREQALTWWPEGFKNDEEDAFRYLLDEMVGLGILRTVEPGHYTLRSPNVVALIGTQDEIETELLKPREAPLEYEPATFRAALGTGANVDHSRRSPLTAQQEAELRGRRNGVSIVFGCQAADLGELPAFLQAAIGQEFFVPLEQVVDRAGFARRLDDLATRERDGTTLILAPAECPWSPYWVDDAVQRTGRLRSKTSFVRVLFVADPQATWALAGEDPEMLEQLTSRGVTTVTLRPWHDAALRQWLEDCGFGPDNRQDRARITQVSGNWPVLLRQLYGRSRHETHRWERHLDDLALSLQDNGSAEALAPVFGLDLDGPRTVLHYLATGEATADDLTAAIKDMPAQAIKQSLRWADLLALVHPTSSDSWRVDPVVARVLATLG